jgi:hypothetical protein
MRYRERRDSVLVESLLIMERDTEDGSGAAACPPFTSDDTPHQPSVAYHEVGKHIVKRQQIAFLGLLAGPSNGSIPEWTLKKRYGRPSHKFADPLEQGGLKSHAKVVPPLPAFTRGNSSA